MNPDITIFSARKIITQNNYCPVATHVAVKNGRILGVGTLEKLSYWGEYYLDNRFSNKVLLPGFVEGHGHTMAGECWQHCYLGYDDQHDPEGRLWPGVKNLETAISRLLDAESRIDGPDTPLIAWQYDPIFWRQGERGLSRVILDKVSTNRPIMVMHASGHVLNVNSRLLELAGIDSSLDIEGLIKDSDGHLTGELRDLATQFAVLRVVGNPMVGMTSSNILMNYAQLAVNSGVTTATELYASLDDKSVESYLFTTRQNNFPLRLVVAKNTELSSVSEGIECIKHLRHIGNEKLYFGSCKIIIDGSIQGFTARLKWPGYFNGSDNGLWKQPPETLKKMIRDYHAAGIKLHIHVNGDEATELALDALEAALTEYPVVDHRHTLQHCQMASESQFRRMAKLGVCVNLFSNHIYYWGDQHASITMGPDRAEYMNSAATAKSCGVPFAIHSDVPVTPLNPLFTMWCAVNRQTRSGMVLGEMQRISVAEALHAVTLGAAYTLHLDHLIGSIEPGKFADFAVLECDPFEVSPEFIKDIPVWGTVISGIPYSSTTHSGGIS